MKMQGNNVLKGKGYGRPCMNQLLPEQRVNGRETEGNKGSKKEEGGWEGGGRKGEQREKLQRRTFYHLEPSLVCSP